MKKIFVVALGLLLFGLLTIKPTLAYQGNPNVKGPNYSPERHEAMLKAFENKDYNAWKNLMANRPITQKVNAQNFAKFAQAHQLALQGKIAEANKIRAELGLGQGMGQGLRSGFRYYNK